MSLPNGWKKVRLSELGTFSKGSGIKRDEANSGSIPAVRYGEIYTAHNDYIKQFQSFISENVAKEATLLKNGDLLFSCSGETKEDIGKCVAFVSNERAYAGGDIIILSPTVPCDSKYIGFLCNSSFVNKQRYSFAQGDSIVHISSESIGKIEIPFPPLNEQKKIAATLSVWDSAIEKMEKLIDAKEDQKKSLIWKLIESNDNRKIKLGKVVVDKNKWRKSKLSDVASGFDYGMNAAAKEYDGKNKYIRITDIDDVSHKFNSIDLVSPNAELEDKYRVNEGDILFARTGASTGKSYLYDKNDGVLYFAGFLIRVHVLKDDPFFIYVQTLSSKYQNWLKKMSMRSGQPGVNAEEYKNLPILVPTLPEQNAITEVLFATDEEISLLKQQLENYKKQKQGLMQKLLIGQWRVK